MLKYRSYSCYHRAKADYEAEFGEITEREMREQAGADRASAEAVRGKPKTRGVARRRRVS
jgi:hypothetical protein